MNYIPKPTLEHIALVKVAAILWNQDDVKDLLAKFCISAHHYRFILEFRSDLMKVEAIAVEKVAKLPVPKLVKEKIACIIRPVGLQILNWKHFHYRGCDLRIDLPKEFCWTPIGTIDKKKTAEVIIKDLSIDIATRYKLACIFCLEDDIPKLWEQIPEDCKKYFWSQKYPIRVMQKELVVLWTCQIKGEVYKMNNMTNERIRRNISPYQYAFELSAGDGNRVATEYFLTKLTSAEREDSIVKTAAGVAFDHMQDLHRRTGLLAETYSDVLCFLLSQLDKEQQLKLLKSANGGVLECLLDWPWQKFFTETANHMWSFLSKFSYESILNKITRKIIHRYKDFNYQKLFQEFWKQSPHDYKRYILSDGIVRIVSDLFWIRDEASINLIFQDATPEDKRSFIYHDDSLDIFGMLVDCNQMRLLKFYIKECLPSKEEVVEFKKHFDEFRVNDFLKKIWQCRFLSVLDDIICEFKKRKSVEGECSKTKRV